MNAVLYMRMVDQIMATSFEIKRAKQKLKEIEAKMNKPHKHAEVIKAWADGAEIEVRHRDGLDEAWNPLSGTPNWLDHLDYRVKPAEPEKVYPETQMIAYELDRLLCLQGNLPWERGDALIRMANAVLRHAVEHGYLVTPQEANENAREHFNRAGARNADRDMAVAKAVCAEIRAFAGLLRGNRFEAIPDDAALLKIIEGVKS